MSTVAYARSSFGFFNQVLSGDSSDDTTVKPRQINGRNCLLASIRTLPKKQELLITDKNLKFYNENYNKRNTVVISLMSDVKIASITDELRSFANDIIPDSSPIFSLQNLEIGWDGYGAEPLSQQVLLRANQIWNEIKKIIKDKKNLPAIHPTANGSVAFSWTQSYPRKELEISLIDNSTFLCEWLLSHKHKDIERVSISMPHLCKVIREYMEK